MEEAAAGAAASSAAPCRPSHSPRAKAAPIRVVARICPGGDPAGTFQVAARVPDPANSCSASVSFIPVINEAAPSGMTPRNHREHKLDWCYLKDNSDTDIFQNEVKCLVDNMFCGDGRNRACVITCGSIAKTHLVMGSEDHPGLLTMAMERILDCAKSIRAAISVSSYQVLQDNHVFDILEPKDSEVLVREDADGRTHLKGLSKVGISSVHEFQNLCYGSDKLQNPTKPSNEARGHRGFIIFISRIDQNGRECSLAKMHFLELAGYINNKQKSHGGGFAQSNSNKSLYAVMDVVQALNSHQSFIPYRKSKVTHMLQDSLCKTSGALLIACLDEVSCQDAISTLSLASRSSQVVNEQCYNLSLSTKGCSKSNINLSVNTKNLSTSLLPSIQQQSSVGVKSDKTQFNNNAVKGTRALNANKRLETSTHSAKKAVNLVSASTILKHSSAKSIWRGRSETSTHSAKKAVNLVSASTNLKHSSAKSILRGRNLFFPTINSSKEDKKDLVRTAVVRPKEVAISICMEIKAPPLIEEKCGDTENNVISSEMQEEVSCSMKELVSSDVKEEDHSSSAKNLYADLGMTCSSNADDKSIVKIQALPPIEEKHDDAKNRVISYEMQDVVPCNMKELVSSDVKEEDQSSSTENLYADLGMTYSSNAIDKSIEENPVNIIQSSPKISDRLREISNSLKLLSTTLPSVIVKEKTDIVHAKPFDIVEAEPKTPEIHLKVRRVEDLEDSLKARTTGFKKSLAKECLSFMNSASKEQLKSLKGIGEKRANFILSLREESPEPLKDIDDLRSIVGMNKREINKMLSEMVLDSGME